MELISEDTNVGSERRKGRSRTRFSFSQKRSERYKSSARDAAVKIDVRPFGTKNSKLRTWDLSSIEIDVSGGQSVYGVIALTDFPHLADTLKVLINEWCWRFDKGDIEGRLANLVNLFCQLVAWMFQNGRYQLADVELELCLALGKQLASGGWWAVLDYEARLDKIVAEAALNEDMANNLRGKGNTGYHLDIKGLMRELKLPLYPRNLSRARVCSFAKALGYEGVVKWQSSGFKVTPNGLDNELNFINALALLDGHDSLKFVPFPNPEKIAKHLTQENPRGRTSNLSIDDAVKILDESLKWIFLRADGVIQLCELARQTLEEQLQRGTCNDVVGRQVSSAVKEKYEALKPMYDLPFERLEQMRMKFSAENSLQELVHHLQTACAVVVLLNHARRCEEVIGYSTHWGLYRGCVTSQAALLAEAEIDIYIQKTLQRYAVMYCNELTARCVDVLERLTQTFRPLGTNPLVGEFQSNAAREDKLFYWRSFTRAGFAGRPNHYCFRDAAPSFFVRIGVSTDFIASRAHPFRRLFALLYMYRHDHPLLTGLCYQLCHFSLKSTEIYVSDLPGTPTEKRIRAMLHLDQEQALVGSAIEEVRSEYSDEKIEQILSGQGSGAFARIIVGVGKTLERDVRFLIKPRAEKVKVLCDELRRSGHRADPRPHVNCMLGDAKQTRRRANCFDKLDGCAHPERADPALCTDCAQGVVPDIQIKIMEGEVYRLEEMSEDYRLPKSVRVECGVAAEKLQGDIERQKKTGASVQALVAKMMERWDRLFNENEEFDDAYV